VAAPGGQAHTGRVASWGSYSYVYGPLMAVGGIVVFCLLLRWAFGRGGSVVERPGVPGRPTDYGLLTPVAAPATYVEGEMVRQALEAASVRATLAQTNDGPRIMVWPSDLVRARAVLAQRRS